MRVLAVGAHPDDLELLCGGTLARFAADGHDVVMCHATRGEKGSVERGAAETARVREEEARRAAALIGAAHRSLGIADGEASASDRGQQSLMVELVRETRPELVLTHDPADYHPDHREVSRLVVDGSFRASIPLHEPGSPAHDRVPPVFFFDTVAGLGFEPAEFVDVSAVIETKAAMLASHESQLAWLRAHDGVDVLELMRVTARFRGAQCGVAHAEAFRPCLSWPRATTRRLLP